MKSHISGQICPEEDQSAVQLGIARARDCASGPLEGVPLKWCIFIENNYIVKMLQNTDK